MIYAMFFCIFSMDFFGYTIDIKQLLISFLIYIYVTNDPQYDISKPYCFFDDLEDNINDVIMECDFVNSNFVFTTNIIDDEDFEESLEIHELNDVYKDSLYLQMQKNYKVKIIKKV